ncbi:PaaI family thioesterase [Zavarzinia sp. CC-PAN008]|uniref:PaaI family thioesterase n=1 Tax=Zavarzinia sp. CC-PAN008 TaxID=3243332 RepID=UPI003F746194
MSEIAAAEAAGARPPPQGFTVFRRISHYMQLIGPAYEAGAGADYRIGLYIDERHTNRRGETHGAVMAALADTHLGRLLIQATNPDATFATIHLGLDYLAPAKVGQWLEARGQVDRMGRSVAYSSGFLYADGKAVLRATGVFRILG